MLDRFIYTTNIITTYSLMYVDVYFLDLETYFIQVCQSTKVLLLHKIRI